MFIEMFIFVRYLEPVIQLSNFLYFSAKSLFQSFSSFSLLNLQAITLYVIALDDFCVTVVFVISLWVINSHMQYTIDLAIMCNFRQNGCLLHFILYVILLTNYFCNFRQNRCFCCFDRHFQCRLWTLSCFMLLHLSKSLFFSVFLTTLHFF